MSETTIVPPPPVRCFLSYVHDDDEDFQFVQPFKKLMSAVFAAATGRRLEIFVDRDSIGWGEDWREKISTSVTEAVVFIPVVTARYFESESCREELLAFYSKSSEVGVTDLLLPVILMGGDLISDGSPDEVVRTIDRLQYRNLEKAWISGIQSAEWRASVVGLVDDLKAALDRVETALVEREGRKAASEEGSAAPGETEEDPESGGALDLMVQFHEEIEGMTASVHKLEPAIVALGSVADSWDPPTTEQARDIQRDLVMLASRFREPARQLEATGQDLNQRVTRADSSLRLLVELAQSSGIEELRTSVQDGVHEMVSQLGDMRQVETQMSQLLESMRSAEVMNVSLRKSLRPARTGIANIRDALGMLAAWEDLVP